MNNPKLALMAFAYAVCAVTAGYGQGLTNPWNEPTPLTTQDRQVIASTVQTQIHGKPPNTTAAWNNPDSGHSGTVTLLNNTTRQGLPCERIAYRIIEPGGRAQHGRYVFTSCRLPDGSWKFAD
jgi:surface antigen